MKIKLLKHVGNQGIILDWKQFIPDRLEFDIGEDGMLTIGQRSHKTVSGKAVFIEYELMQGNNKVTFVDKTGMTYPCGVISRSNRFMAVHNPVDDLVVKLALAYEEQSSEIARLKDKLKDQENNYGIKIV